MFLCVAPLFGQNLSDTPIFTNRIQRPMWVMWGPIFLSYAISLTTDPHFIISMPKACTHPHCQLGIQTILSCLASRSSIEPPQSLCSGAVLTNTTFAICISILTPVPFHVLCKLPFTDIFPEFACPGLILLWCSLAFATCIEV